MIPKSIYTADNKYPALGGGYDKKRGHFVDPFWEEQGKRWQSLLTDADLRNHIISMNIVGITCKNFRHFSIPPRGLLEVYGDSTFYTNELEGMITVIRTNFPDLFVSKSYPCGQFMYAFSINLVSIPIGEEVTTIEKLALVINEYQSLAVKKLKAV